MVRRVKYWFIYKTFLAYIFAILIPINISFAQEPNIISKDEANWVFNMSLEQWKQMQLMLEMLEPLVMKQTELMSRTLIINTPPAIMMITPVYSQNNSTSPGK